MMLWPQHCIAGVFLHVFTSTLDVKAWLLFMCTLSDEAWLLYDAHRLVSQSSHASLLRKG